MELKHERAMATSCDMDVLDGILKDAALRFFHVGAIITVIKKTAKHPRIYNEKCIRNFQEGIEIDLGKEVLLKTSPIGVLKPAEGCL